MSKRAPNPSIAAARVGYQVTGPDGLSGYRALYLGLFGALGVATLLAARRVHEPLLADVICAAIVAEAGARLWESLSMVCPESFTR